MRSNSARRVDRTVVELHEIDDRCRFGKDALDARDRPRERAPRRGEIAAVDDADLEIGPPFAVRGVDLHGAREDDCVRNEQPLAAIRVQNRKAQVDLFDRALEGSDDDLVADAEGLVDH